MRTSSSSLGSLSKKAGPAEGLAISVSYKPGQRQYGGISVPSRAANSYARGVLTWTNSIGVFSPRGRDADILVAGNAFGTIFTAERFRGLEMKTDLMDTVKALPLSVRKRNLCANVSFLGYVSLPDSRHGLAHAHEDDMPRDGIRRVRARVRNLHRFWSLR